jgi:hypothetical protein
MQVFFIFFNILGLIYFGLKKRCFDFYSLAFLSAIVYFMPGFFGYVIYPTINIREDKVVPIIEETYLVMIAVLIAILMGAFIYDQMFPKLKLTLIKLKGSTYAPIIIISIALIGFMLTIITTGDVLFSPKKSLVMEALNRWQLVWSRGSALATVVCFAHKKWRLFFIGFFLLAFNLYIGFRVSFAMAIIANFTIWMFSQGKQQLLGKRNFTKYWRQTLIFVFSAYLIFFYKNIYIYIKAARWDLLFISIKEPDFYLKVITQSEPFITQTVLNEVISRDFTVGIDHIIKSIASQLLIYSGWLNTKDFNELFQPQLFPYQQAGLAANIWAEMWSGGGWFLLIIFIGVFTFILGIASFLLRYENPTFRGGISLFFSYWAFYIHRNDIYNQLSFQKQIFLLWIFVIILCYAIPIKKTKKIIINN